MEVKLKHKLSKEIISEFSTNSIKIINNYYNLSIKIKINREVYNVLCEKNYPVSFEQNRNLFSDDLSDEETLSEIENSKDFFINFSLILMDDHMLNEFHNLSFFSHITHAEKEHMKIKYLEKCDKIKNIILLIDNKEVDINETISNEQIIFKN